MSTVAGKAIVVLDAPEMASLPLAKSEQIRNTFVPMADMLQEFEGDYAAIMAQAAIAVTPELSARARRLRLDISKVRLEAEYARKILKEEYLLAGRAIDGTNNILKWAISQKEEALGLIEHHAERMEAERIAALQAERERAIAPYMADGVALELGRMPEDVWQAYIGTKQQQHADKLAAEQKAEQERVARIERERAEQEAIRAERDRLAAEAKEKEAARKAELAAIEAARQKERKAAEQAQRKAAAEAEAERAKVEAAAKEKEAARLAELAKIEAARQKERKAAEAERLKVERAAEAERKRREELEAIERDRLAKTRAEEKARAAAEAKAAKAPVRKRLLAWIDGFALPELPGADHEAAATIRDRFNSFVAWSRAEVEREL